MGILLADSFEHAIDLPSADERSLHVVDVATRFTIDHTAHLHGVAFWFDVAFDGSSETVWLSTAPTEPLTHWYQVRCVLRRPLLVHAGGACDVRVRMVANARQSYDVDLQVTYDGQTQRNSLDLKNPFFRYTGTPVHAPPGFCTGPTAPSEQVHAANAAYWAQQQPAQFDSNPLLMATAMLASPPVIGGVELMQ